MADWVIGTEEENSLKDFELTFNEKRGFIYFTLGVEAKLQCYDVYFSLRRRSLLPFDADETVALLNSALCEAQEEFNRLYPNAPKEIRPMITMHVCPITWPSKRTTGLSESK